jgi:hypothetical protein
MEAANGTGDKNAAWNTDGQPAQWTVRFKPLTGPRPADWATGSLVKTHLHPWSGKRSSSRGLDVYMYYKDLSTLLDATLQCPDRILRELVISKALEHVTGDAELAGVTVEHRMAKEAEAAKAA